MIIAATVFIATEQYPTERLGWLEAETILKSAPHPWFGLLVLMEQLMHLWEQYKAGTRTTSTVGNKMDRASELVEISIDPEVIEIFNGNKSGASYAE